MKTPNPALKDIDEARAMSRKHGPITVATLDTPSERLMPTLAASSQRKSFLPQICSQREEDQMREVSEQTTCHFQGDLVRKPGFSKGSIPPPPRLSRSSSLRQPVKPNSKTSNIQKHSRHASVVAVPSALGKPRPTSNPQAESTFLLGLDVALDTEPSAKDTAPLKQSTSNASRILSTSPSIKKSWDRGPGTGVSPATGQTRAAEGTGRGTRPNFTTFNQHFSPKKPLKAPTTTFHGPARPNGYEAESLPPEVVRLQNELLQLHIIHDCSFRTRKEWELGAKAHFRQRFEDISRSYKDMQVSEAKARRHVNHQALEEWIHDGRYISLAEKAHILARAIQNISDLTHAEGKYDAIADRFDEWFQKIQLLQETRLGRDITAGHEIFDPIGDDWNEEVSAVSRKLDIHSRELQSLGGADSMSGLGRVLNGHRHMLSGLLGELGIMQTIASEAMMQERDRVKGLVKGIFAESDGDEGSQDQPGASAWQTA